MGHEFTEVSLTAGAANTVTHEIKSNNVVQETISIWLWLLDDEAT